MTERRRPLETDDGQGALFGGEGFAPAGPAPAWKRAAQQEVPTAPSEPEAGVDVLPVGATVEERGAADLVRPTALERGADAAAADVATASAFEAQVASSAPQAYAPNVDSASSRVGDAGAASLSPFADEIAELERATVVPQAPLAGPTLDDFMSRVWEGLATGLPAACPLCEGEVVPVASGPPRGRCSSCATTIE